MISFHVDERSANRLVARFTRSGQDIGPRIRLALESLGARLESRMRSNLKLSKRTGKLERSFYHLVADGKGGSLVLTTGVRRRAFYAAFQDIGVKRKEVTVRSHTRGRKSGNVKAGRKKVASGVAFVSQYRREMYLNPAPFIGVSMEQMRQEFIQGLRLAVAGALASGS